jgi:hypothetical protein
MGAAKQYVPKKTAEQLTADSLVESNPSWEAADDEAFLAAMNHPAGSKERTYWTRVRVALMALKPKSAKKLRPQFPQE